ncbi:MAG: hypothetical protein IJL91_05025 [Bacteroidales bacterium]|nr:hypothetical protein [Bacteroidales bacterium]
MKKAYKYLTFAVIAVLGTACSKNPVTEDFGSSEYKIGFGKVATKAAEELTPDTEKPLQITVYDYLTKSGETTESEYFNDIIQESTTADAPWAYVSGKSYSWKVGAHEFIGYVSKDSLNQAAPGISFANKVLTVAANTPLPGENNFDYRYSKDTVVNWTRALEDTPVELKMKHLSAALTYSLVNNTDDDSYAITSVSVGNIATSAGATVTYGGEDGEVVAYSLNSTKGSVDLIADARTCVWPQTLSGATLTVSYTVTENGETVTKTGTMPIPDDEWENGWEAGMVYNFVIEVVNKNLTLTFKVLPWDLVDKSMDTSDGSINMSNVTWMNSKVGVNGVETNTVDIPGYTVNMFYHPTVNGETYTANNGYYPAQGFFTVNYPESGKFFIGLIPAYGETEVDEDAYEIWIYDPSMTTSPKWRLMDNENGEDISRTTVYFQVRAAAGQDGAQHKAQINIWFIPDGSSEKISAYSEIRANYALVIPATN